MIIWDDYFTYNPDTGDLFWKPRAPGTLSNRQWNTKHAGKKVGGLGDGGRYLITVITVNGVRHHFKVHRICYEMHYGPIPEGYEVDHIDHVTTNNRASNFEIKPHAANMMNMSKQHNNTSGCAGVHFNKASGTWIARIGKNKRYLGSFVSLSDAVDARKKAEKEGGYHDNHGA